MSNWKTFTFFSLCAAVLMSLVILWDFFIIHVDIFAWEYMLVKGTAIGGFYLLAFHAYSTKKITWHQEIFAVDFYLYSLYGMSKLDMTYSFSFVEAFMVLALGMQTSSRRFIAVNLFGVLCCWYGFQLSAEPSFVAPGQSYKHHAMTLTFILFIIAMIVHFFIARYQRKINDMNERFALIGKQSTFLMHELKSPINRLVHKSETAPSAELMQDISKDIFKISSLISSVETMIYDPEALKETFHSFEWAEVSDNIQSEFQTYLASMNVRFELKNFEGKFHGNKYLLYQLIKNLLLNAIEAIDYSKPEASVISLSLGSTSTGILLRVSNTSSTIPPQDLHRIFDPHFSTKKKNTNKGLGLPLAKNIAEAHGGKISVRVEENLTIFEITLKDVALV